MTVAIKFVYNRTMIKVLFVCLGNICRSPMAEFVLKQMVAEKGLVEEFEIASAGTEEYNEIYHESLDYRAGDMLKQMKIPYTQHYSHFLRPTEYAKFDYILAMDDNNVRDILAIVGGDKDHKVRRLLDFTNIRNRLKTLGIPAILMKPIGIYMRVAKRF